MFADCLPRARPSSRYLNTYDLSYIPQYPFEGRGCTLHFAGETVRLRNVQNCREIITSCIHGIQPAKYGPRFKPSVCALNFHVFIIFIFNIPSCLPL